MRKGVAALAAAALAAVVLAGCIGEFEVQQTEPFRVQIDGDGEEAELRSGGDDDDRERRFIIDQDDGDTAENVRVVVEVRKVEVEQTTEPAIVLIIIEDEDTGERLAEEQVSADDSAMAEIDLDVRGNNNIVIITQAVQGDADVTVSAQGGEGDGGMEPEPTETTEPTQTTEPTMDPTPDGNETLTP